jgi:hypothetical protein
VIRLVVDVLASVGALAFVVLAFYALGGRP